ncbi:MAG: ExbD/TolR family protein [Bacteroidota bacterium]
MAKRKLQEINAGSMADIAFLLLIFFLVTTTMDTDVGISRLLPPIPEDEDIDTDVEVKERNVFVVLVNANDQLMVEGEPMDITQLKDATKEFLLNPNNDPNLPEKEPKQVPFFGEVEVHKGVISLRNDNGTTYNMYIMVQDALTQAGNEVKDEVAMDKFGKVFDDLDAERQDAVKKVMPVMISEAEPKNIGGNN